jgi:DNA-directed RNA polymerase alpha subunit
MTWMKQNAELEVSVQVASEKGKASAEYQRRQRKANQINNKKNIEIIYSHILKYGATVDECNYDTKSDTYTICLSTFLCPLILDGMV